MMARFKIPLISLTLLLAAVVVVFFLEQPEPPPLEFESSMGIPVVSPAIPLPALTLTDQNNNPFPTSALRGKWNLLFFGYTNCPDICPTTLATLNQVAKQLPQEPVSYIFVTLDPRRDTPAKLKDYLAFFNPAFIGLTGDKADIDLLSEKLGVFYDYEGDVQAGTYVVNHYAAILVIDPEGRLRAHILPPHTVDKIVDAVNRFIDYYGV